MTGPGHAPGVRVREAGDGDHAAVRRMLTAYHLTTEREKGCPVRATAELDRLRVEPAQRGRGLGEPALRDAVRRCADAGTGTLRLSAWEWRSAAIPLHRRTGSTDCPPWDPRPGHVCLGRRTG